MYHPHKRRTWKKRALCQSGWYRGSWKIRPGQNLSVRDFFSLKDFSRENECPDRHRKGRIRL